jgi:Flp pilus assembly protein TadG
MIRALLLRLRDDHRGVATIEFALLSVLFFFVMTAALDLGMWYQQRLRLDSAVEQGAMVAFNSRTAVDQAAVGTYVAAAAQLSTAPTVTVGCNGGTNNCVNSGRTYACVSGSTPTPTYTAAALNAACADGSVAGYYMTIKAVATSSTMLVPAAILGGNMVQTRSAVVRLE